MEKTYEKGSRFYYFDSNGISLYITKGVIKILCNGVFVGSHPDIFLLNLSNDGVVKDSLEGLAQAFNKQAENMKEVSEQMVF